MQLLKDFISLFFPHCCKICQTPLFELERVLCTKCIATLPYTQFWRHHDNPVAQKFWGHSTIEEACSLLYFRKGDHSRKLIHALKYNNQPEIGEKLGILLGSRIKKSELYKSIDTVIPVPLHAKRLKQRGYNQSQMIAQGIAKSMNIALDADSVIRSLSISTQTKKNRLDRFGNVRSIFTVVAPEKLEGRNILLVDDVITTGATIESCAAEILSATQCKVSIASIGSV